MSEKISSVVSVNYDGRFQLNYDPTDHEYVAAALFDLQKVLDERARERELIRRNVG